MWPFDWFGQRRYKLRHKAALIVLLGQYLQNDLPPEDRERIEAEMDANFKQESWPPSLERRLLGDSEYMAAYRASAMDRLGIEPRIPAITWAELFRPWSFWRSRRVWPIETKADLRAPCVGQHFFPMDKATADARALLRRHGMQIPDFDPWDRYPFPEGNRSPFQRS